LQSPFSGSLSFSPPYGCVFPPAVVVGEASRQSEGNQFLGKAIRRPSAFRCKGGFSEGFRSIFPLNPKSGIRADTIITNI
jgi:hypothetical protein